MVSVTVSVPKDVREKMLEFPEVNWSALVRKSIIKEVDRLKLREEMLSELEGEKEFIDWSVELGRKAKKGRLKRLLHEVNS